MVKNRSVHDLKVRENKNLKLPENIDHFKIVKIPKNVQKPDKGCKKIE